MGINMGINKEQGILQLLSSSDSETALETDACCEDIAAQLHAAPEQGSRVRLRVVMLEYSFESVVLLLMRARQARMILIELRPLKSEGKR